ncbi:MAG: hypothetical protein KF768_01070 [Phycisphaeraceae bacterium]|nr:hypothetical protein [Phycisphaeraceae bacterium]
MPIDERELSGKALPTVILDDRVCAGCGYSLKGLRTDGKCPECGRAIRRPSSRLSAADDFTHAPLAWLRAFSTSAQCAFFGYLLFVGCWIACAVFGSRVPAIWGLMFFPGLLLVWGVIGLTQPRPVMPSATRPPGREWFKRRIAARVCSLGWLIMTAGTIGHLAVFPTGVMHGVSVAITYLGFAVAIVGLAALFAYLSEIADWANDIALVFKLRAAIWIVGGGGIAYLLAVAIVAMGVSFFEVIVLSFCALAALTGTFVTALSLYRVVSLSKWAMLNQLTDRARTDRLKEKAERAKFVESEIVGAQHAQRRAVPSSRPAGGIDRGLPNMNLHKSDIASRRAVTPSDDHEIYELAPEEEPPVNPRP